MFECTPEPVSPLGVVPNDHPLAGQVPLAAPLVQGVVNKDTTIVLLWQSVQTAASYVVYRSTSLLSNYNIIGKVVSSTGEMSFIDRNVQQGQSYFYKLATVTIGGLEGRDSDTLKITCIVPNVLYLRNGKLLSPQEGLPVPYTTQFLYPSSGGSNSFSWHSTIDSTVGDVPSFGYCIYAGATVESQLIIAFVVSHEGKDSLVALDSIDVKGTGRFAGYSNVIHGSAFYAKPGDNIYVTLFNESQNVIQILYNGASNTGSNVFCPFITQDAWSLGATLTVLKTYGNLLSPPCGLAWDGSAIWYSGISAVDLGIFRMNLSGQTTKTLPSPCLEPLDLCWNGHGLGVIAAWSDSGRDTGDRVYLLDTSGTVQDTIHLHSDISTGLDWDGYFYWGSNATDGYICQFDNSGNVIMSFSSPTPFPRGLAWDGQYLWIADPETQRIIKVDTQGRILNKYNSPGTSPSGLAWDGQHLWVADLVTYKIYELQVP
jgi:hypothetical protein